MGTRALWDYWRFTRRHSSDNQICIWKQYQCWKARAGKCVPIQLRCNSWCGVFRTSACGSSVTARTPRTGSTSAPSPTSLPTGSPGTSTPTSTNKDISVQSCSPVWTNQNVRISINWRLYNNMLNLCRWCYDCYWVQSLGKKYWAWLPGQAGTGPFWGRLEKMYSLEWKYI